MTAATTPDLARQNRPLAGIGYISVAMVLMTTMDTFARFLVLDGFSVFQILAIRSWAILAVLLAILPRIGGLDLLRTRHPWAHVLRAVCGAGAPLFFFASLRDLPLADATAMFFGSTFLMTALSVPVLGERVGLHRWSAVAVGFIGVVIVTRPGSAFEPASMLAVAASICYALMVVIGRWMGPTEPVFRQMFFFNVGLVIVTLPVLPFVWMPLGTDDLTLLGVVTMLSIAGQFFITRAFVTAPIGVIAPFEYTALVWAALCGYIAWGDVPDIWVISGSAVIVLSGLYILHRESILGRRATAAVRDIP